MERSKQMNVYEAAFYFIACAFIGWVMEVFYYSTVEHRLTMRGFLIAPFLPIYGFGAIISLLIYDAVGSNIFAFAIMATIALTVFEYFSGLLLEMIFRRKWWDYDQEVFNLNGRICLKNSVYWAILSSFGVYILFPYLQRLLNFIPEDIGGFFAIILISIIIIDAVLGSIVIICNDDFDKGVCRLYVGIKRIPGVKKKLQIK